MQFSVTFQIFLFFVNSIQNVYSCIVIRRVEDISIGCQCPLIQFAVQKDLRLNKFSSYLANRDILWPEKIDCSVTVTPGIVPWKSYDLMIFRSEAPPIIAKRYRENLTIGDAYIGLICQSNSLGEYEWYYYGEPIKDVSMALLNNEEQCECGEWEGSTQSVPGFCDTMEFNCPQNNLVYFDTGSQFNHSLDNNQLIDAICVDGYWWFMGQKFQVPPKTKCSEPVNVVTGEKENLTRTCDCRDVIPITKENQYIKFYDPENNFVNFTLLTPLPSNRPPTWTECVPMINCPTETEIIVIFSGNFEPIIYDNLTSSFECGYSQDQAAYWVLDGIQLTEAAFACFSPETSTCLCKYTRLNEKNIESLIGSHPFYSNVTSYPIRSPDDTCNDEMCPPEVSCPTGYSLVIFDTNQADIFSSGNVFPSCSINTKKWTVEGNELDQMYSLCVNYSAPILPCACKYSLLDETNIESLIGSHPFYSNVTSYPIRSPDDTCNGDKCLSVVECAPGYTLVLFENIDVQLISSGTTNISCSISTRNWTVEGKIMDSLRPVCVNYSSPVLPCACNRTVLDETNIENLIGSHPFYSNISLYSIRFPDDTCEDEQCPSEISCPTDYTLVIFDTIEAKTFSNQTVVPKCSLNSKKWSIDDIEIERIYSICVKYPVIPPPIEMNGCKCSSIKWIDQAGIAHWNSSNYLSSRPTFYPLNVSVSNDCVITVDAPSSCQYNDFYFMIFREADPPIFVKRFQSKVNNSPFHPIGLTCEENLETNKFEWKYYGGIIENMSFALQSNEEMCSCGQFPGSTQIETGICDIFQITCALPSDAAYLHNINDSNGYDISFPSIETNIVYEATCAAGVWYYNGIPLQPIQNWEVQCKSPVNVATNKPTTYLFQCGCREVTVITPYNGYLAVYDPHQTYFEYRMSPLNISYDNCVPKITCDRSLFVFSRNNEPIQWNAEQMGSMVCASTPLADESSQHSNFWFIDGKMLIDPAFTCLELP